MPVTPPRKHEEHSGVLEEDFQNIRHRDINFLILRASIQLFQVPVVWQIQIRPLSRVSFKSVVLHLPPNLRIISISSNNWPRANLENLRELVPTILVPPRPAQPKGTTVLIRVAWLGPGPIRGPYRQDSCGARCSTIVITAKQEKKRKETHVGAHTSAPRYLPRHFRSAPKPLSAKPA